MRINWPELVEDWKQAAKWASVRCMALSVAISTTWVSIPDDMRAQLPATVVSYITMALGLFGILGRITKKPTAPTDGSDAQS